ncbi:hypothetical protein TWF706_005318 [Orbilia oligospora]|nr:hypothetical protein TWF706_005318 [Orbilia oligospora]
MRSNPPGQAAPAGNTELSLDLPLPRAMGGCRTSSTGKGHWGSIKFSDSQREAQTIPSTGVLRPASCKAAPKLVGRANETGAPKTVYCPKRVNLGSTLKF